MSKRKRYDLINQFLEGINAPFRLNLRNGMQIVTLPDGGAQIVRRYSYHWMPALMAAAGTQLEAQQSVEALSCNPNWIDGAARLANYYRAMQTVQIQGSAQHDMDLLFTPESNPIHHAVYQLILRTVDVRTYQSVVFNDLTSVAGQASRYIVIHCNGKIGDSYATE